MPRSRIVEGVDKVDRAIKDAKGIHFVCSFRSILSTVHQCASRDQLVAQMHTASKGRFGDVLDRVFDSVGALHVLLAELDDALSGVLSGLATWEFALGNSRAEHKHRWWTRLGGNAKVLKAIETELVSIRSFEVHSRILARDVEVSLGEVYRINQEIKSMRDYIQSHSVDNWLTGDTEFGSLSSKLLQLVSTVDSLC